MIILNGNKVKENIILKTKLEIKKLKLTPQLAIIQIGDNFSSNVYIRKKKELCENLGIKWQHFKLNENIKEEKIIDLINILNKDRKINGIILQLPIPLHLNEEKIINLIDKNKDVDCFNNENVGKLWNAKKDNETLVKPCTPFGIINILKYYKIPIMSKNVVIVGRSNIVGKPLAELFLLEEATVTICHSKTKKLPEICKNADILVVAIGNPKFFNKKYINKNQVIVDVGINRDKNNKICGDVDFDDVKNKIKAITPVPGGVGVVTVAMLIFNLIILTKLQCQKK